MPPDAIPDIRVTAQTLWGEARGEDVQGMKAVASVISNRVYIARHHIGKFGKAHPLFGNGSFADCCLRPFQFSCWLKTDPNYAKINALKWGDPVYFEALQIASDVYEGILPDDTNGALYYYSKTMKTPPKWAIGKTPCADIGTQLFFNDIN